MIRSIIAASLLALNPPPSVPADYQVCVPIHNGPLQPIRHMDNLYPRKGDLA